MGPPSLQRVRNLSLLLGESASQAASVTKYPNTVPVNIWNSCTTAVTQESSRPCFRSWAVGKGRCKVSGEDGVCDSVYVCKHAQTHTYKTLCMEIQPPLKSVKFYCTEQEKQALFSYMGTYANLLFASFKKVFLLLNTVSLDLMPNTQDLPSWWLWHSVGSSHFSVQAHSFPQCLLLHSMQRCSVLGCSRGSPVLMQSQGCPTPATLCLFWHFLMEWASTLVLLCQGSRELQLTCL